MKYKYIYKIECEGKRGHYEQVFFNPKEVDALLKYRKHFKLTIVELKTGEVSEVEL